MRAFKTKSFMRWARKIRLDDDELQTASAEIQQGSFEADLGGGVIKKRIALQGRGKRGGARTIVAHKSGSHLFSFMDLRKTNGTISTRGNSKHSSYWARNCLRIQRNNSLWRATQVN